MDFIKAHQLTIMLFISGICGSLALLALVIRSIPHRRKMILAAFEASAMLMLLADRYAYLYRGVTGNTGWWMVRISNFLTFFLWLVILYIFTLYLDDLLRNEGKITRIPPRLQACKAVLAAGAVMLVISQFTGLYYTFNENNEYMRTAWMPLSYAPPFIAILLQLSVVYQYRQKLSRVVVLSLLIHILVPLVAAIVQLFLYGISLTSIAINGVAITLFIFALVEVDNALDRSRVRELKAMEQDRNNQHVLFEQTAEALVNAIDAKDQYTHGHSSRVAQYSVMIAREAGKTEEEISEIYYAALLHDVGKIGVPDQIINKVGKLTDEEYAQMKLHPVYGNNILSRIQKQPNISIGAKYHHERYDGKGYPDGLKGEDIPEIARIIGVADAYDAMTSKRSYRNSIPQHLVREELVKGIGSQFDPVFARIMIHLLDQDVNYEMQDHYSGKDTTIDNPVQISTKYNDILDGVFIVDRIARVHLTCQPEGDAAGDDLPVMIVFDALDGRIHEDEPSQKKLSYCEFARIRLDGKVQGINIRNVRKTVQGPRPSGEQGGPESGHAARDYDFELVRYKDHAMITIISGGRRTEIILALPDSSHFIYAAFRGENWRFENVSASQDEDTVQADYIPRIAEEISYIRGCPEGDIPSIQIDSWRSESTKGIPVPAVMDISFHTRSLPTARLVWHCPFVCVYTSRDGQVNGDGFREFMLLRLDGETWESDEHAQNTIQVDHTMAFEGWQSWKDKNLAGIDISVNIRREENRVMIRTENLGIAIAAETEVLDDVEEIYVALTGDQCALTNIRISG